MNSEFQKYPALTKEKPEMTEAVRRSIAKPDAFAKPGVVGNRSVRVRLTSGDKSLKRKKRKDKRDVTFY